MIQQILGTNVFWALMAGMTAISCETVFKKTDQPYLHFWWFYLPMAVVMNYCVFRIIKTSDTMLAGFIVFTTTTAILRICAALFIAGENPSKGTYAALALMLVANIVKTVWR